MMKIDVRVTTRLSRTAWAPGRMTLITILLGADAACRRVENLKVTIRGVARYLGGPIGISP